MNQTGLFDCPSPAPVRAPGERTGESLKAEGMKRAAENRRVWLALAQQRAKVLAMRGNTITIDDVFADNLKPEYLGNAAGSVFKTDEWEFVEWVPSKRPSNHGRPIRSWRLR